MTIFKFLKQNSLSVFLLLLLFGCSQNAQNNGTQNNAENSYQISMDTIWIPIDENCLGSYSFTAINGDFFYGKNNFLNTIDVFDLRTKKTVRNIPIQKEGPHGIPMIDDFVVNDSLLIIDGRTHFFQVDFQGSIVQKIPKKDFNVENKYEGYTIDQLRPVSISNFRNLVYLSQSNELIIPLYNKSIQDLRLKYAGFCAVAVHLNTKNVELLPIPYPELFKQKRNYGNLDEIQLTVKGDSIVYNFPNSSEIHLFNRKTKRISDYTIDSKYTPNRSDVLDFHADRSRIMDHYLKSTFFHRIVYDPYRNLFFRLHASKCESDRFLEDRNFYLVIMNDSFEKLDEIVLPSTVYPIYNVTKKGLLFSFLKPLDEDFFSGLLLRLDGEKENQDQAIPIKTNSEHADTGSAKIEKANSAPKISKPAVPEKKQQRFPTDKDISLDLLRSYVEENLVYPEDALKNEIEGHVYMLIQYDSLGVVNDRRMLWGCENPELETEAWRIIHSIEKVKTNKKGGFGFPVVFDIRKYKNRKKIDPL
jgi:hypothetical protein